MSCMARWCEGSKRSPKRARYAAPWRRKMSATSSMRTSGKGSEALHELVERVGQGSPHLARQMGVDLGGAGAAVTEVLLDEAQVDAGLEQVGGVGMAQSVNVRPFDDSTVLQRAPESTLQAAAGNRAAVMGEAVFQAVPGGGWEQ